MNALFKASEICDKKVRRKELKDIMHARDELWKEKVKIANNNNKSLKSELKRVVENESQLENLATTLHQELQKCLQQTKTTKTAKPTKTMKTPIVPNNKRQRDSVDEKGPNKKQKMAQRVVEEPKNKKRSRDSYKNSPTKEIGKRQRETDELFESMVTIYSDIARDKLPLRRKSILLHFHPDKLPKEVSTKYGLFSCRVFHSMRVATRVDSILELRAILEEHRESLHVKAAVARCLKTKLPPDMPDMPDDPDDKQEEEQEEYTFMPDKKTIRDMEKAYRDVVKNYAGPKMTAHGARLKRKLTDPTLVPAKRKKQ